MNKLQLLLFSEQDREAKGIVQVVEKVIENYEILQEENKLLL